MSYVIGAVVAFVVFVFIMNRVLSTQRFRLLAETSGAGTPITSLVDTKTGEKLNVFYGTSSEAVNYAHLLNRADELELPELMQTVRNLDP